MAKYKVHIWINPIEAIRFSDIEAKTYEEAWLAFSKEHGPLTEKINPQMAWFNYQGKDGRVYRRKAKLTRL